MIPGKVNASLNDPVVVHLDEVALAHLLVLGDEALAISATNVQYVAAFNLPAVGVFVDFHTLHHNLSYCRRVFAVAFKRVIVYRNPV